MKKGHWFSKHEYCDCELAYSPSASGSYRCFGGQNATVYLFNSVYERSGVSTFLAAVVARDVFAVDTLDLIYSFRAVLTF